MMKDLRLGVIGLSEGNGHPYSWSAIFNGYAPDAMAECPFPVIPEYLAERSFPEDAIAGARVTHVWTQERALSEHVAAAARIEHVVDRAEDMIGSVDALLLARDDAESHLRMARPFLEAGLAVFVDKPLALSVAEADRIFALESAPGRLMSASALAFAEELQLTEERRRAIGAVRHVQADVIKDWDRYGVHVVEPVLKALWPLPDPVAVSGRRLGGIDRIDVLWPGGLSASFTVLGAHAKGPIQVRFFGSEGAVALQFTDTFAAFRASLLAFVTGVRTGRRMIDPAFTRAVVGVIERGCQALGGPRSPRSHS